MTEGNGGIEWLRGVIPVLPTPFTTKGDPDLCSFDTAVAHTLGLGVRAVMYPGVASEHAALTGLEKSALLARLIERTSASNLRIIAAVSSYSTDVAIGEARAIAELDGVDGVNVLPSAASATESDLIELYSEIAEAIPSTPVVLQYAPEQMRATISMAALANLGRQHPNVVAVKIESNPCQVAIGELARENASLLPLVGNAGIDLLPSLAVGARGVQPGPGFVEVYKQILDAWERGDHTSAEQTWRKLVGHLDRWRGRWLGMSKLVARERGIISTARCRRPTPPLPADALSQARRFIADFDLPPAE